MESIAVLGMGPVQGPPANPEQIYGMDILPIDGESPYIAIVGDLDSKYVQCIRYIPHPINGYGRQIFYRGIPDPTEEES